MLPLSALFSFFLVCIQYHCTNAQANVVRGGLFARFAVFTPEMIRMEWSSTKEFRDEPTIVMQNRKADVFPEFTVQQRDDWIIVRTKALELRYLTTSTESFNDENLVVKRLKSSVTWKPSDGFHPSSQLFGTMRTLDGRNGYTELDCYKAGPKYNRDFHCTYGVISRSGMVVIDDTNSRTLDDSSWPWIKTPRTHSSTGKACEIDISKRNVCGINIVTEEQCLENGCCFSPDKLPGTQFQCYYGTDATQDLYIMGHGHNYKQALKDFTTVAGKIPLPPRYAMGVFFSRYWAFNDYDLIHDVVNRYEQHNVPLDNLVIDMDWHKTFYGEGGKDQAGEKKGWTGFTWDKHLFPNAHQILEWLHSKGLHVTLNLHPASGIQPWEDTYVRMATAMGIDPKTKKYVPLRITDKKFAENWMNITLAARENEGVDFWWLDWQQGEEWIEVREKQTNLNPTIWLNHIFFTNPNKWGKNLRPLLLHRWGGLGNHRYQLGFSGDVQVSWASLKFQPYFTAMAANVGYAYWSHDLGGHTIASPPELYTRWIQWGAFSPVFRTHCTKDSRSHRRIWKYEDSYYEIMRDAMTLRMRLLPYIYTQNRLCHDTGLGIVHGLYFEWPEHDEAYSFKEQYMFGESMFVSPVTDPVSKSTEFSNKTIWFPPGKWVDWFMGKIYQGPKVLTTEYMLHEIPIFIEAGGIIPLNSDPSSAFEGVLQSSIAQAQNLAETLHFLIMPGAASGKGRLYEDDGKTQEYLIKGGNWTNVEFTMTSHGNHVSVVFSRVSRSSVLHFFSSPPAEKVSVGGQTLEYCSYLKPKKVNCWAYDGTQLMLNVYFTPSRNNTKVDVSLMKMNKELLFKGFRGQVKRLHLIKDTLDNQWDIDTVYMDDYPKLLTASETDMRITFNPHSISSELASFYDKLLPTLPAEINNLKQLHLDVKQKLLAQLNATLGQVQESPVSSSIQPAVATTDVALE